MKRVAAAALLLCLGLMTAPMAALGQEGDDLEAQRRKADRAQEEIVRLAEREKSLTRELAAIEAKVAETERQVATRQKEVDAIRAESRRTKEEHRSLEARRAGILRDLRGLLAGLWPIHMKNMQNRFQGLSSWDEVDRRFTWMSQVYGATRVKFTEAREASRRIEQNLERQKRLELDAEAGMARLNEAKDQLARNRLALRAHLSKVRGDKRDLESELQEIMATIKELSYQMGSMSSRHFEQNKGRLAWPAEGERVSSFSPEADPPRHGLGLSLSDGQQVRAVFWGKVVHNDTLRGFGRVVILYHGDDFYSLYAFLSESEARAGQEVEKGEPIGRAGYYPEAKGPGLYFELRFRQKPINPVAWLSGSR